MPTFEDRKKRERSMQSCTLRLAYLQFPLTARYERAFRLPPVEQQNVRNTVEVDAVQPGCVCTFI